VSGFHGGGGRNHGRTIGVAFSASVRKGVLTSVNYGRKFLRNGNFAHWAAPVMPPEMPDDIVYVRECN
jgi:hypothetical protein